MDGIEITRILDLDSRKEIIYGCDNLTIDYSLGYDEVPEDEILKMIEVNEGTGPDFKHLVKLTPSLTHPSLKKRKTNRRSFNDFDGEDPDETPPPVELTHPFENLKKKNNRHKLQHQLIKLIKQRNSVLSELASKQKTLEKVEVKLKKGIQLLDSLPYYKKSGYRFGGTKLRTEIGIMDKPDGEMGKEPVIKRGRGRPRKILEHIENKPESSVSDPVTPKKLKPKTPLKEQDFNTRSSLKVILKKLKLPVESKVVEDDVVTGSIRRSNRQMRCTEKLASLIETSPKLSDGSMVVRKILNEGEFEDQKSRNEKSVNRKRKLDILHDPEFLPPKKIKTEPGAGHESIGSDSPTSQSFKQAKHTITKGVPSKRKLKTGHPPGAGQEVGVESPGSDSPSCQSFKQEKQTIIKGVSSKKKLKTAHSQRAGQEVGAESTVSDCTSCRSFKQAKQAMMKGVSSNRICEKCMEGGTSPSKCQKCFSFFHPKCVGDVSGEITADWTCPMCVSGTNACFVCKDNQGTRQMCLTSGCGKYYHGDCLKMFPQTKFNHGIRKNLGLLKDPDDKSPLPLEILTCARHFCHTCASDNPNQASFVHQDKLLICISCPTAYHCTPGVCLTAGTEILSTSDIFCGKHQDQSPSNKNKHANITWCFVCNNGGSLTGCALCPSAIHPECLKIKPPEGKYYCDECESGRFPLHGEIVWVKLGNYRWWPSKILYPDEVPLKVENTRHRRCEFAVMFFGTKDYQWVGRGRTFIYNEGDTQNKFRCHNRMDKNFQLAMEEASIAFQQRQEVIRAFSMNKKEKPEPYTKIRSNKYTNNATKKIVKERSVCTCTVTNDETCGLDSGCVNRGLLIECSPDFCPARSKCLNQCFTNRQYAKLEIYKTANRGWGVKCKEDLQQGQFVIEYVGQVIDDAELEIRMKIKREMKNPNYYLMRLETNQVIDAEPCGNDARFINHSCRPNCETVKWNVNGVTKIGIFAMKFIPKGEELTFNYNWMMPGMSSVCCCGDEECSGVIGKSAKTIKSEKKKKTKSKISDTECFLCHKTGDGLIICSAEKCPTVVHQNCAQLPSKPTDWLCSHHLCDVCKNKTKRHCQVCKTAYCASHTNNNIFSDEKGQLFCSKHVAEKTSKHSRKSTYLSRKEKIEIDDACSTVSSNQGSLDSICSLV